MSEALLKAIVQLFAIVAKERITQDERNNIQEFLSLHLNQESIAYYLQLFDQHCSKQSMDGGRELQDLDDETAQFIGEWSEILKITKKMNEALTIQQKVVLVIKIIELVYADGEISDRQANLIFYIGESLKLSNKELNLLKMFVMGDGHTTLSSQDIILVSDGVDKGNSKSLTSTVENFDGLLAILRIPEIQIYFVKYIGESALNLNGIALRNNNVVVFPTGSSIKGGKVGKIYYSDVVSKFLEEEHKTKLSFQAEHLFYHFKSGRAGIQNINISEEGGKLIGLMGASGAGKSTLLNVLNGIETPTGGRVLINGINIHEEPNKVEGVIGYVPQDDLLIEELSVFQNLYFAAELCFSHYSPLKLTKLVDKVLMNLGLSEIKALKVGSPLEKTISGGQRKRLNIGLELLREPTVLYVDEPTSGLSSRDSENIMDLLKELSLKGKLIFVVIHQPSSEIFKLFDSLLILDVGGFQIYYGNPVEAVTYFREIMDSVNKTQGSCPECGNINPEQIFNLIETKIVDEYGKFTNTRKVSPGQWYQFYREKIHAPKYDTTTEKLPVTQNIPNWLKQLKVFIQRDVLSKISNKQYMTINLLEAPLLALFMSFLIKFYNNTGNYSFYENENIPIYFFMSIIVALFMGLTVSAEEIIRDRKILKREKFLNLSKSSYLVSKIIVLFTISAIQTISFVLIGNYLLEIQNMNFSLWLILFSASCFANLLGLNISATFNSAVTIYILIPILLIPQILLSGVVISFDKFNPMVGSKNNVPWFGNMMASRWAFEAAVVDQFKENEYEKMFFDIDRRAANAEYKKTYYLPELEKDLLYCFNNLRYKYSEAGPVITEKLSLLQLEIQKEMKKVGEDKFKKLDRLTLQKFDSATFYSTKDFFGALKIMYNKRYNSAIEDREVVTEKFMDANDSSNALLELRNIHVNQSITDAVKNVGTAERISYSKKGLIRKVYPIYYFNEFPNHPLDISTKFYAYKKHIFGKYYPTLYYNVTVMWLSTIVLVLTLYFDLFRRILVGYEKRKFRRRQTTI